MLRYLLTLFCLGTIAATSQEKGNISLRFVAERAPAVIGQVNLITAETKSAPFALPTNNLSAPIKVAARALVVPPCELDSQ
jgi:hypothetical protein